MDAAWHIVTFHGLQFRKGDLNISFVSDWITTEQRGKKAFVIIIIFFPSVKEGGLTFHPSRNHPV